MKCPYPNRTCDGVIDTKSFRRSKTKPSCEHRYVKPETWERYCTFGIETVQDKCMVSGKTITKFEKDLPSCESMKINE